MPTSLNEAAMQIISPILDDPGRFGARIVKSPGGATIVDLGIEADGSWPAGQLWAEAAHGGMAKFSYGRMQIKDLEVPSAEVVIDQPMLSVVACESGAWKLGSGAFTPVGSGPARAKAQADRWSKRVEYKDPSNHVLLQMQINRLPDDSTLQFVADACQIPLRHLTAMVAPSASLVGSIQVASRAFEQCIMFLGRNTSFDITTITHGYGRAPIAPVIKDELLAMGRINDALVYGGSSGMWLRHPDDEEVRRTTEAMTFSARAGEDYGKGYGAIYDFYGRDLFKIPPHLDSPAKVTVNNLLTGSVFVAGKLDEDRLYRSFTERV